MDTYMTTYVIFDADGNYENVIFCEEHDILPDGYTKKLVPAGYRWDGNQIIGDSRYPINLETI
jgi:hypothetical protein